jgi:uncharacterized protein (DUF2147 family)
MKTIAKRMMQVAAFSAVALAAGAASAAEPTGVWYDHTGRGAVEITKCGSALCGKVVWIKDSQNGSACGMKILGNVKPMAGGVWDGGWIYDPDRDSKFSVELTMVGAQSLKVVGYMGSKMLSETMTWRRAPADLKRCGGA